MTKSWRDFNVDEQDAMRQLGTVRHNMTRVEMQEALVKRVAEYQEEWETFLGAGYPESEPLPPDVFEDMAAAWEYTDLVEWYESGQAVAAELAFNRALIAQWLPNLEPHMPWFRAGKWTVRRVAEYDVAIVKTA